jgi:hypothetical protein
VCDLALTKEMGIIVGQFSLGAQSNLVILRIEVRNLAKEASV